MSGNRPSARGRLVAIGLTGAVLVVIAATGFLRHDTVDTPTIEKARAVLEGAGCTLTTVRAVPNERDHSDVTSPDQVMPQWNTDPPTSGPHYGEPAVYGIYTDPVQQARLVHNLEHGAVFIQYGARVPKADIAAITAFYASHQAGTVVAPYPALGTTIALGAWIAGSGRGTGVLGRCPAFHEKAFEVFFDTFQFKGNERFPASSMQPGST
jgi:hypothetical protein